MKRTGFDETTVMASLRRLDSERPPFFERMEKMLNGGVSHVFAPTGHVQRATSQWSKAEDKLDELIKILSALAEKEPDKEKAQRFAAVPDHLSTGGRDFAVGVITNLITGG